MLPKQREPVKPKIRPAARLADLGAADARSKADTLTDAVAELKRLDASSLQKRWRSLVGRPLPPDLGRPLMLRVLAYKLQAQHLGDLDRASLRELTSLVTGKEATAALLSIAAHPGVPVVVGSGMPSEAAAKSIVSAPVRFARPGTLLVREHGGVLHRVMVLDAGVTWNGRTYDSLSQVAFAITGTRWNGPRFFGLRSSVKADRGASQGKQAAAGQQVKGNRAPAARRAPAQRIAP